MAAHGWAQITHEQELLKLCKAVINENSKAVKDYQKGKNKAFTALLGQVAKKSEQRANMSKVSTILKNLLTKQVK